MIGPCAGINLITKRAAFTLAFWELLSCQSGSPISSASARDVRGGRPCQPLQPPAKPARMVPNPKQHRRSCPRWASGQTERSAVQVSAWPLAPHLFRRSFHLSVPQRRLLIAIDYAIELGKPARASRDRLISALIESLPGVGGGELRNRSRGIGLPVSRRIYGRACLKR